MKKTSNFCPSHLCQISMTVCMRIPLFSLKSHRNRILFPSSLKNDYHTATALLNPSMREASFETAILSKMIYCNSIHSACHMTSNIEHIVCSLCVGGNPREEEDRSVRSCNHFEASTWPSYLDSEWIHISVGMTNNTPGVYMSEHGGMGIQHGVIPTATSSGSSEGLEQLRVCVKTNSLLTVVNV